VLVGVSQGRIISGEGELPAKFEHWMIKFAAKADAGDAGPVEYAYALMAGAAGIDMPPFRLFEAAPDRHYFGVQRFDRLPGNQRLHVHTFGNMVHADFRIPSSDYADLFKVTRALTRNHADVLRLFRRMVFNIAAHNRDDHVKNFAFLLNEVQEWTLTPAYDLTYSSGPGGEHSMTVLGEGRNPGLDHCLELAAGAGIKSAEARAIIGEVNGAIGRWPEFASMAGCSAGVQGAIGNRIHVI
jgi:serine/threonine-protein kinase HipA